MARDLRGFCGRLLRLWLYLCLGAAALCAANASLALTRIDPYQATVPLADRSEASQEAAFEAALRIVLVKVTGRRGADQDPAFAPLIGSARRYVQQYRAAPDSQISVAFDGAAALRGVPLIWPSAADLQRNHLDYAGIAGATPAALADLAHKAGGDGVLIGRANGPSNAAVVRWTYLYQDRSAEFSGAAVEGVNRAADTYVQLYAVTGTLAPVDIEVAGIADLKDYASIQAYLESLTFISHVGVIGLSGDTVRFRLTTRGGSELQHALALNGRLQPIAAGENGLQRFQLTH
jgi:hypothetical protein